MATPTTQDVSPDGTPEQNQALYQGTNGAPSTIQLVSNVALFTATSGTGGLSAGLLCYYAAGPSTLLAARANAVATSRKIMGVTPAAVSAGVSATLIKAGQGRITADVSCVPVIGAEAYLSGATAGNVTSAISGTMYPRQVGYFMEGAVAGDGTVLVDLSLDDARDDAREWMISDSTLVATATLVSLSVTRSLWRELTVDAFKIGPSDAAHYIAPLSSSGVQWYNSSSTALAQAAVMDASTLLQIAKSSGANARGADAKAVELWSDGSDWLGDFEVHSFLFDNTGERFNSRVSYRNASATDFFTITGVGATVFQVGSRVLYRGKVRLG